MLPFGIVTATLVHGLASRTTRDTEVSCRMCKCIRDDYDESRDGVAAEDVTEGRAVLKRFLASGNGGWVPHVIEVTPYLCTAMILAWQTSRLLNPLLLS
jgi:hypothetical protein